MTVCKNYNGLGKIKLMPFGYICTCAECKGTGEIRDYMTNDEWRKICSAEEFAEWITDEINAKLRALYDVELYNGDVTEEEYMEREEEWLLWLKEKHE